MSARILIVEDEEGLREVLSILLEGEGHTILTAANGTEGLALLDRDIFDLIITDIKMPGASGYDILKRAREIAPETLVIMVTAFGTLEDAIDAMKQGAFDYIQKPFKIDEIRVIVRNAIDRRRLSTEVSLLREQVRTTYELCNIVGKSPAMVSLLQLIPRVAKSGLNVLITGESGTGKDLVANALHTLSDRSAGNFVPVNCAAFPEGLLESELFGHVRGAFTGAVQNKRGLFEVANHGTLFLDEIGEMPISLQSKLLRAIENGTFRRVGDTADITVDARIIAATNRDLKEAVAQGTFREDLYFRLNGVPMHIPPLRERKEDLPLLIGRFIAKSSKSGRQFSGNALRILMEREWKGNVRELENAIERILMMTDDEIITESHLPPEITGREAPVAAQARIVDGFSLEDALSDLERGYLIEALRLAEGNKTEAAKLLGLTFRSIRHRLVKHGIK